MRKIALVIPTLRIGGAEKICTELCNSLATKFEVYLISFDGANEYYLDKRIVQIILCKNSKFNVDVLRILWKLRKVLIKLNPSGIFTFMERANIFCRIALMGTGISAIPTIHAMVESFSTRKLIYRIAIQIFYKHLFPRQTKFIVVSKKIKAEVQNRFGLKNVDVIPNGLNISNYTNSIKSSTTDLTFAVVARLHPEKRIEIAIHLINELNKNGVPCSLKVIGIGSERTALENLSIEQGIEDRVIFLGYKEKPFLDLSADCLLVTSRSESFGIVILEAILSGIPVISINCPSGPGEIALSLHGNGMRLSPFVVEEAKDAAVRLASLVHAELQGLEAMKRETYLAKKFIIENYSIDKVAEMYIHAIDNVSLKNPA